jgi:hypothetical protein
MRLLVAVSIFNRASIIFSCYGIALATFVEQELFSPSMMSIGDSRLLHIRWVERVVSSMYPAYAKPRMFGMLWIYDAGH